MMRGNQIRTLITGKPRLTLRPLEALLDAMLRLRHPRQFLRRCARVRVREIIIIFICDVRLPSPPGGPDNSLVRVAERQEDSGGTRPDGEPRLTRRLLRLRRPDERVVRATRGSDSQPRSPIIA